ncbi:MAG TPA: WbqC family protein [Euzebyales bacterium]|nr:WbqC family protein [Euzebyales bacterium]
MTPTRVAVYQPQYFPRLHYLNRALDSDVFVVLDSAQFTRRLKHHGPDGPTVHPSYQAHAPIRLASGHHMLTVPVRHGGTQRSLVQAQVGDRDQWVRPHLRSLHSGYATAPQYPHHRGDLEALLDRDHEGLAALNLPTLLWAVTRLLGVDLPVGELTLDAVNAELAARPEVRLRRIVLASSMAAQRPEGRQQGNAWTAALCAELGADEYLCGGTAAGNYMDKDVFNDRGIQTVIQSWHCERYRQQFADRHDFMPNLSVLDLLLNVDAAAALAIVRPG